MITDITIVHNDPSFELSNLNFPYSVFVKEYYLGSKDGKKKGWALKSDWGAKEDPFIICYKNDNAVKCFYSEVDNSVINSLMEYLNANN